MALPVQQFPILSFQQANPLLTGMQAGSGLLSNTLQNAAQMQQLRYLPQQMQMQLMLNMAKANEANQHAGLYGAQIPWVAPQAQANIAEKYSQVPLNQARTSEAYSQIPLNQARTSETYSQIPLNQARANQANAMAQVVPYRYTPTGVAALTAAKQQATTGIKQWQQNLQGASKDAVDANNMINLLDQAKAAYEALGNETLPKRGAVFGSLPTYSSNAQMLDRLSNQIAAKFAGSFSTRGATDKGLTLAQKSKLSRDLNPAAFNAMYNELRGVAERARQNPGFLNSAANMGLDPNTANVLWNKYLTDSYAGKNVTPQDYLAPQAINSAISGKDYTPPRAAQQKGGLSAPPSQADLIHTAKKYGLTVEQVKQKLGVS